MVTSMQVNVHEMSAVFELLIMMTTNPQRGMVFIIPLVEHRIGKVQVMVQIP